MYTGRDLKYRKYIYLNILELSFFFSFWPPCIKFFLKYIYIQCEKFNLNRCEIDLNINGINNISLSHFNLCNTTYRRGKISNIFQDFVGCKDIPSVPLFLEIIKEKSSSKQILDIHSWKFPCEQQLVILDKSA